MMKYIDTVHVIKKAETPTHIEYQVTSSMLPNFKYRVEMEPRDGKDATRTDAAQLFLSDRINCSHHNPDDWVYIVGFTNIDNKSTTFICESKNRRMFL